jgi:hypothetical protein
VLKSQCFLGIISTTRGPHHCSIIRKPHLCECARLISRSLGKIGVVIAVFPGTISTARGPQHCSIIKKLHLCTCARQSLRSLGKIGAKSQCFPVTFPTARRPQLCSIIRNLHLCACSGLSSRSLGKIGEEIAVFSWNNFYCQWTTALFRNQETAPLHMRQTEVSLSWQEIC